MRQTTFDEFVELAKRGTFVPVWREIMADLLTPVSAFLKIAEHSDYAFLLESVEGGEHVGRYSFLGKDPFLILRGRNDETSIEQAGVRAKRDEPCLAVLRELMAEFQAPIHPDLPRFIGGAVGYLDYDAAEWFEPSVKLDKPARDRDQAGFMVFDTVLAFDHVKHRILAIANARLRPGEEYTLRDLLQKGYTGTQVRYLLMQTHYKTQLNFTFAGLDAVKGTLQRLQDFIQRLMEIHSPVSSDGVKPVIEKTYAAFANALADDLNISSALASVFDMVREINGLCDGGHVGKENGQEVIALLKEFNRVLGVLSFEKQAEEIPQELEEALAKRIEARKQKNWALSDSLRDFIVSRGYTIEDTSEGARLKKN